MPAPVPDPTPPWGATVCSTCSRAAFFQARIESPAGREPARRANACASHLVEVIELLGSWARDSQLAGGSLTVLAIDPYALPRMTALGLPESGFAFYTTPVTGRVPARSSSTPV
jgi:hypothetical protein